MCGVDGACSVRPKWIARWMVGDKERRCGTAGDNGEPIWDRAVPSRDREKLFERPLAQPPHLPYPAPKQMSNRKTKNTHSRLHISESVFCGNSGIQHEQQPPAICTQHDVNFCVTRQGPRETEQFSASWRPLIQRSWKVSTMSNSFCVSPSSLLFSTNVFSAVLSST